MKALLIIPILMILGSITLTIIKLVKDVKNRQFSFDFSNVKNYIFYILFAALNGIGLLSFGDLAFVVNNIEPTVEELVKANVCGFFAGVLFIFSLIMFVLTYYKKNINEKIKNVFRYTWLPTFLVFFVVFLFYIDAGEPYYQYPLVNGFGLLKEGGLAFTTPENKNAFSFSIAFYAIAIIGGALVTYATCDHIFYQRFGKHGLIESTFFIAFPAGIIGSRIWYVIGNWNVDGFCNDFGKVFRIWEGGLTIIGGIIFGALTGIIWVILTQKRFGVLEAIEIIVPTILIAQVIGRWGNFFNNEVHGLAFETSKYWYLPKFIQNNMRYSSASSTLDVGQMYMPLFLIEGIFNLAGYFIIRYVVVLANAIARKIKYNSFFGITEEEKKYRFVAYGTDGGLYLIWYGVARGLLEPLRDPGYKMGSNQTWSEYGAYILAGVGVLFIVFCFLYQYLIKPNIKKNTKETSIND